MPEREPFKIFDKNRLGCRRLLSFAFLKEIARLSWKTWTSTLPFRTVIARETWFPRGTSLRWFAEYQSIFAFRVSLKPLTEMRRTSLLILFETLVGSCQSLSTLHRTDMLRHLFRREDREGLQGLYARLLLEHLVLLAVRGL